MTHPWFTRLDDDLDDYSYSKEKATSYNPDHGIKLGLVYFDRKTYIRWVVTSRAYGLNWNMANTMDKTHTQILSLLELEKLEICL